MYSFNMKLVPIRDLKMNLSFWIKHISHGETVAITKHNETVAFLSPAKEPFLHFGKNAGKIGLKPALHNKRRIKNWFKFLNEDRNDS